MVIAYDDGLYDNEGADIILRHLLAQPENKVCFDCNLENPSCCAYSYGIFICKNCAYRHCRVVGYFKSKLRLLYGSEWGTWQLSLMIAGGNKRAKSFLGCTGGTNNIDTKYMSESAVAYKELLHREAVFGNETERRKLKQFEMGLRKKVLEEDTYYVRKRFPNAKSISYSQFVASEESAYDMDTKRFLEKYSGSSSISSDDLNEYRVSKHGYQQPVAKDAFGSFASFLVKYVIPA